MDVRRIGEEENCNMNIEINLKSTSNSNEVTLLPNPPTIFLQKLNDKLKNGHCWLYWSKLPLGPIAEDKVRTLQEIQAW